MATSSPSPRALSLPTRPRLRVGLIGGLHRSEGLFVRAAAAAGFDLEFHAGDMVGRRAQGLTSLIQRVDLLFIVTDVNSHNAVTTARRLASEQGTRHILLRRCNPAKLIELVQSMTTPATARAA